MLEDEVLEEISADASVIYMSCTNLEDFVALMSDRHHNVSNYVFRIQYFAIEAADQ